MKKDYTEVRSKYDFEKSITLKLTEELKSNEKLLES